MVQIRFDDEDPFGIHLARGKKNPKAGTTRVGVLRFKTPAAYKSKRGTKAGGKRSSGKKNNSVVVKITGGAKTKAAMYQHFRYISRRETLQMYDSDNQSTRMQDAKSEAETIFDLDEARAGAKKSYQLVFSIDQKGGEEQLRHAVYETMKELYPDNKFYFVVHNDTDHTHAHVVLMRRTNDLFKRVEINKSRLNKIKKIYSQRLNKYGIQSEYLSESEKQVRRGERRKNYKEDKRKGNNIYTVVDFGEAPYQFRGDPSYYLLLKNKNGVIKQHWSKGLADEIALKEVKVGDHITLKKTNKAQQEDPNDPESRYIRSQWEMEKKAMPEERFDFSRPVKIIDYGDAPYKFDANGKDSFYVLIQQDNKPVEQLWAKDLKQYIENKGIKPGDELVHGTVIQQQTSRSQKTDTTGMKI